MKKFLSLLLTGVMSAMLLAGCGTTANDPEPRFFLDTACRRGGTVHHHCAKRQFFHGICPRRAVL